MKKQIVMASWVLMLIASPAAAQTGSGLSSASGSGRGATDSQATTSSNSSSQTRTTQKDGVKTTTTVTTEEGQATVKFVRTLTNVQVELTLTDQIGTQAAEKKTVSMIVSSGNWGKIRSAGNIFPPGEPPYSVELNVDARPFVSTEGQVQLEMTLVYAPLKGTGDPKDGPRPRPSGINQSQTIVLQSGRPLIVSQAADPINDRKVVVEVKATVLK